MNYDPLRLAGMTTFTLDTRVDRDRHDDLRAGLCVTSVDPVPVTRDPWDPDELKVWADGGVPIRRTIRFRVAVREACVIRSVIVAEDCASDWFIVQLPRGFQAPGSVMTVDVVRCRTAHPPYFRCVLVGNLVSRSELDVWHASLAKAE